MSAFKETFACQFSCQQRGHSIFKHCNLISSYGAHVESFKQNNNVQKSCDAVHLRHFKWFCSTFQIKHTKQNQIPVRNIQKIISSMNASESFLKYYLKKNIKHFLFKIQFFSSVLEILNYKFSKKLFILFLYFAP